MPSRKRAAQMPLELARGRLRGAGLRCTAARIAVMQCLSDSVAPLSSSEVAERLHDRGFDKSTIYRSLTELSESGLATRLDLGDAVRRFELRGSEETQREHPHFMCIECGRVQCLDDFRFELLSDNPDLRLPGRISEVLIKGRCNACL